MRTDVVNASGNKELARRVVFFKPYVAKDVPGWQRRHGGGSWF
jgi:hypothetical protein